MSCHALGGDWEAVTIDAFAVIEVKPRVEDFTVVMNQLVKQVALATRQPAIAIIVIDLVAAVSVAAIIVINCAAIIIIIIITL